MTAIVDYVNGAIEELKHIRWPIRQQAIRLSAIVLVFIAVNSVFFGLLDYVLSQIVVFLLSFAF